MSHQHPAPNFVRYDGIVDPKPTPPSQPIDIVSAMKLFSVLMR